MISQHSQQQQKLYTDQPQHWNLLPIMRRWCEPTKSVWSDWIMDTRSPLGVWQQDVGTRSFGCCGLQGGASVALACYGTSCGCWIGVWSGDSGGRAMFLEPFWSIFAVRLGALSQCVARGGGVRVKVASTWLPGPEVSQQIICIATTWSVLFTSSVNGFNVVADWCMLWDKQSSLLWVISRSVFV